MNMSSCCSTTYLTTNYPSNFIKSQTTPLSRFVTSSLFNKITISGNDDVFRDFIKDRENGDFVTKITVSGSGMSNTLSMSKLNCTLTRHNYTRSRGFLKLKTTSEWLLGDNTAPVNKKEIDDDGGHFVSIVCWRKESEMVVAANSSGSIKLLLRIFSVVFTRKYLIGLKYNLLSVSQICDIGYHVDFFEEHCEVVSNSTGKVVLKGYRHGNIYEARLSTSSDDSAICLLSRASIEESWNWHKRLSYLNFNNINDLVKKDLVRGLPKSVFAPDGLCDSCQKEKQRKSSFKSKTESSIFEPYHLLHVDLFGPVNVMSIAKKKYAMVIVDEFTRYTWVYFLHKKNETASTLTDHVGQLDKLVKDSVKIIRSDNGTEFKNSIIEEFFKEHGIK
ncbi:hypothetical protein AgCh_017378 [Apium graveolens]